MQNRNNPAAQGGHDRRWRSHGPSVLAARPKSGHRPRLAQSRREVEQPRLPPAPLPPRGRPDRTTDEQEARECRFVAAWANYLSLDRPDIAFATKQLCRCMASQTMAARIVYHFAWQPEANLDVFVDTDFAGCTDTRPSTSGGVAMRGSHLLTS